MNIYLDESGFTGRALLDPAQPFFCVASTNAEPATAIEILAEAFPDFKGREMKFQTLWRRAGNHPGFVRLAARLGRDPASVFGWVVDKRFCVFQKLIDFLIEPDIHEAGFDFYANAHAAKFSNYAHDAIIFEGSRELYIRTTDVYYGFARHPSEETLAVLQGTLREIRDEVPADLKWFYELAHRGAMRFHRRHVMGDFSDTSEIQLSCVLSSVIHWRSQTDLPLRILHDDSRSFFGQKAVWDLLTSDGAPAQIERDGNGPPVVFPLKITETLAADSVEHPSIQFCDLLAGLIVKASNPRPGEEAFVQELIEAGLGAVELNGLRPHQDYPDGPPPRLEGPDMVDRFLNVLYPEATAGMNRMRTRS